MTIAAERPVWGATSRPRDREVAPCDYSERTVYVVLGSTYQSLSVMPSISPEKTDLLTRSQRILQQLTDTDDRTEFQTEVSRARPSDLQQVLVDWENALDNTLPVPDASAIHAVVSRYSAVVDRLEPQENGEDFAEGLRDDIVFLDAARRSAGTKIL